MYQIGDNMLIWLLSEIKYFLLIAMVMLFMGVSVKLVNKGHPYIGIQLWIVFSLIFFDGWTWLKKDTKTALSVLLLFIVVYLIIIRILYMRW